MNTFIKYTFILFAVVLLVVFAAIAWYYWIPKCPCIYFTGEEFTGHNNSMQLEKISPIADCVDTTEPCPTIEFYTKNTNFSVSYVLNSIEKEMKNYIKEHKIKTKSITIYKKKLDPECLSKCSTNDVRQLMIENRFVTFYLCPYEDFGNINIKNIRLFGGTEEGYEWYPFCACP